jgi:membrane-associated HD superfamily phosphohydrolase
MISSQEIIAPFDFGVLKSPAELARDQEAALLSVNPIFLKRDTMATHYRRRVERLFSILEKDSLDLGSLKAQGLIMDRNNLEKIPREALPLVRRNLLRVLERLDRLFIASAADLKEVREYSELNVTTNGVERVIPREQVQEVENLEPLLLKHLKNSWPSSLSREAFQLGLEILRGIVEPNIVLDRVTTQRHIREALDQVPVAKGFVSKNERVIDRNVRITAEDMDRIRSLEVKLAEMNMDEGRVFWPYLGHFLSTLLFVLLAATFLYVHRRWIFVDLRQLVAVLSLLLLVLIIARLEAVFHLSIYLTPVPLLALALAGLYDSRLAFVLTAVVSVLAGTIFGNDFLFVLVGILSGMVASFSLRRTQGRQPLVLYSAVLFVGFLVFLVSVRLVNFSFTPQVWAEVGLALLNAVLTPFLAMGLIRTASLLFDLTSDLRLQDLADLNHHLLQRLAVTAPEVYQHAITLGNLVAAAATTIGVNPLLARVGAFYRDIGVLEISSREDAPSPENAFANSEEARQAALRVGQEHQLPPEVLAVLSGKALELPGDPLGTPVNPPPGSREVCLVTLADAVVKEVEQLEDPTPEEIRERVEQTVKELLLSGALVRSTLSVRELHLALEDFIRILSRGRTDGK